MEILHFYVDLDKSIHTCCIRKEIITLEKTYSLIRLSPEVETCEKNKKIETCLSNETIYLFLWLV